MSDYVRTSRRRLEHDALFYLTSGDGSGWREVWIEQTRYWVPASDKREFERKMQAVRILGGEFSVIPRLSQDRYFTTPSSCLWVRVETRHAAAKLAEFEPRPTLVLRDGETCKRTAFWWLEDELPALWTLKANERLAHALGGIRKCAALDYTVVPQEACTGVQVVVADELRPSMFHPNEVVGSARPGGKLKDAPDLEALRKKHAERRDRERVAA